MPETPPDLEDVRDRTQQHNLMWKFYKRLARWAETLEKLAESAESLARLAKMERFADGAWECLVIVGRIALWLAGTAMALKGGYDVVGPYLHH